MYVYNSYISSVISIVSAVVALRQQKIIRLVIKKHFMLTSTFVFWVVIQRNSIDSILVARIAIFLKLFELVCVRSANELTVHVKDLTLWIHEELTVVTFDLDAAHDHVIFHVDWHLLVTTFWRALDFSCYLVIVVVYSSIIIVRVSVLKLIAILPAPVIVLSLAVVSVIDVHIVALVRVLIWGSLITANWYSIMSCTCRRMTFLLVGLKRLSFSLLLLILVGIIFLKWWMRWSSISTISIFTRSISFQGLVLEVHWVVCLVV